MKIIKIKKEYDSKDRVKALELKYLIATCEKQIRDRGNILHVLYSEDLDGKFTIKVIISYNVLVYTGTIIIGKSFISSGTKVLSYGTPRTLSISSFHNCFHNGKDKHVKPFTAFEVVCFNKMSLEFCSEFKLWKQRPARIYSCAGIR